MIVLTIVGLMMTLITMVLIHDISFFFTFHLLHVHGCSTLLNTLIYIFNVVTVIASDSIHVSHTTNVFRLMPFHAIIRKLVYTT